MSCFKSGEVILSDTVEPIKIIKYICSGGQGEVYEVEYKGERKAFKYFTNVTEWHERLYDNLKGNMLSQGTTPRRLTDLIGSLCDLTSGSGDKGTPVVFIQGYFDNLADE